MAGDEKWMAQLRRGSLDLCLLAILSRGTRYGYDIVQALSGEGGLVIKEGTIYPLLSRLRGEGLVAAEWRPSPQGPKRRYYRLTEAGERHLVAMRTEWRGFAADVERILGGAPMDERMASIRADYLSRLRLALDGVSADVVREVVDEFATHVDDALAARPGGGADALLDVIARLGPPEGFARDLGLYRMVDRGYRRWSIRHMIGSARFWALSTMTGTAVVLIFGLLYAIGLAATAIGLIRALSGVGVEAPLLGPLFQNLPAPGLLVAGPLALVVLTLALRWFIGQYVRRARPQGLWGAGPATADGAEAADAAWVADTSRTIILLAMTGLLVVCIAGLAAGAARIAGSALVVDVAPLTVPSPSALAGWLGLTVFFLAPMLGLLLTVARDRRGR